MDFRVFSRNISENMHARCVREDAKQALKENLQADGVQSRQTLFVRYCRYFLRRSCPSVWVTALKLYSTIKTNPTARIRIHIGGASTTTIPNRNRAAVLAANLAWLTGNGTYFRASTIRIQ